MRRGLVVLVVALLVAPAATHAAVSVIDTPPDTPTARADRGAFIPGDPLPVPILFGAAGSTVPGRCTQFEPMLDEYAPPGGWDVLTMSSYGWRETKCCPQVLIAGVGWRTTQGGDRFDEWCRFSHVEVWHHRSDAGWLQLNGVNWQPSRCGPCLYDADMLGEPVNLATLGDPIQNTRAAAALCEWWRNAGRSCYRPWRR